MKNFFGRFKKGDLMTAIIVNYHTGKYLPGLLSVLNSEELLDKIIVICNSQEPNIKAIIKQYSKAHFIQLRENIGFGAAVNHAAKKYNSAYYLLINPDTLPQKGFLTSLFEGMSQSDALIAGPRFYWDEKKTFRMSPMPGYSWTVAAAYAAAGHYAADARLFANSWIRHHDYCWNATRAYEEVFISGACMLIKNDPDFFKNGNIFDEQFFLYYEDTDLCWRAAEMNKKTIVVPQAEVVHFWDKSPSSQKSKWMQESHQKFMTQHYGGDIPAKNFESRALLADHNVQNLGDFVNPPVFENPFKKEVDKCYFEIGLNPVFVPFLQTEFIGDTFEIPRLPWENLKTGQYFSRIRCAKNYTNKIWKWKKH